MLRAVLSITMWVGCVVYVSAQIDAKKGNPVLLDFEAPAESSVRITWITPEATEIKDGSSTVDIKIGINTPSKVTYVQIFINGRPVPPSRGFRLKKATDGDYDEIIERQLGLNRGENEIKIVVENEDGSVSSETKFINVEYDALVATGDAQRTDYALLFATDKYDNWSDLVNPTNDATTIAKDLENNYGFEVELVTNVTTDEMYLMLRKYAQKSYLPQDQLFIFIAGHGQFDEAFREGYVVGSNSLLIDNAKSSYISHSNLRTIINNIPCEHIFLAMDVCFGGTFDPVIASNRGSEEYGEISTTEFIQRKLRYKTRRYLTSGGKEYVPDGRPGMHSPFARQFLAALRNFGGQDRIITLSELLSYVEKVSPEPRYGEFGNNEPGSDFIFVAK